MIVASCPTCYRMIREDHFDAHVNACPLRRPALWLFATFWVASSIAVVACWLGA